MKPTVYALISETSGNCIAICANVEDAVGLQINYELPGKQARAEDDLRGQVSHAQEAEELLRRQWVDLSTAIEITLKDS